MIAMIKDGKTVNVPDAHIAAYERMGYSPVDATYIPAPGKTADQRIRELEAENAALKDENSTLKEAHANAMQEFSQAMAANESCAATIRELEAANAKLAEENSTLKADLDAYKEQVFQDLAPAGSGEVPKPKTGRSKKSTDET